MSKRIDKVKPEKKTKEPVVEVIHIEPEPEPNTIETVNLIEYRNNEILNMWSFHDNDAGLEEATELFKEWCQKRLLTEEEIQNRLDDGFSRYKNEKVVLFHSTK